MTKKIYRINPHTNSKFPERKKIDFQYLPSLRCTRVAYKCHLFIDAKLRSQPDILQTEM